MHISISEFSFHYVVDIRCLTCTYSKECNSWLLHPITAQPTRYTSLNLETNYLGLDHILQLLIKYLQITSQISHITNQNRVYLSACPYRAIDRIMAMFSS